MFDWILGLIAPHRCLSCGRLGRLLCSLCSATLLNGRTPLCVGCGAYDERGVCPVCALAWPVERAIVVGERSGVLETLINEFKYANKRAAYRELTRLAVPLLPYGMEAALVPVPTVAAHIRQRGYDHTALTGRALCRLCGLTYAPLLRRRGKVVQHGASRRDRLVQIQGAFTVRGSISPDTLYVVFDDILTTGASMREAVRTLREAGARRIWLVAVARQPLGLPLDDSR